MNDSHRPTDLRQVAFSVSPAVLQLRWAARDLRAAGYEDLAERLEATKRDLEDALDEMRDWADEIGPVPNASRR